MALDPDVKAFATAENLGALTTLFPDGHPQTQIMWVDADDDHLMINTEVARAKYRNAMADPRVTLTIWEAENPYRYIEVRGHVVGEVRGEEARQQLDDCSFRYAGKAYDEARIGSERVILKIAPDRVVRRGM